MHPLEEILLFRYRRDYSLFKHICRTWAVEQINIYYNTWEHWFRFLWQHWLLSIDSRKTFPFQQFWFVMVFENVKQHERFLFSICVSLESFRVYEFSMWIKIWMKLITEICSFKSLMLQKNMQLTCLKIISFSLSFLAETTT